MRNSSYYWHKPMPKNMPAIGEHVLVAVEDMVCEAYRKPSGLWVRADGELLPGFVRYWRYMPSAPRQKRGPKVEKG